MFICNHCPYVKAVEDRIIGLARELEAARRPVRRRVRQRRRQLSRRRVRQAGRALARAGLRLSVPARRGAGCRARVRRGVHAGHLRLRPRSPARLPRAHRRFVEGREPCHAARAGGGDRGAGGGQAPSPEQRPSMGCSIKWRQSLSKALHRQGPKGPWRTYLQRKGLKTTQQREAIVDAFLRSSGHVALEDLLSSARRKHPGVGLATVYRTVKLLEEAGIAAARHFGPVRRCTRWPKGGRTTTI